MVETKKEEPFQLSSFIHSFIQLTDYGPFHWVEGNSDPCLLWQKVLVVLSEQQSEPHGILTPRAPGAGPGF